VKDRHPSPEPPITTVESYTVPDALREIETWLTVTPKGRRALRRFLPSLRSARERRDFVNDLLGVFGLDRGPF